MASQNIVLSKGGAAAGAINKKRFCKLTDTQLIAQCGVAGEAAYGVSSFAVSTAEIDKGKHSSLVVIGRAIVEAADNSPVIMGNATTDNVGRAKLAGSGDHIIGIFDEVPDGVDTGYEVSVLLGAGGKVL